MKDRPLPANLDAERLLLGVALEQPDAMHDLRNLLVADDFSTEQHQVIWTEACAIYDSGRTPDRIMVGEELMRSGRLAQVGGITYLCRLDEGRPNIIEADNWVRIVRDHAYRRRVIRSANELLNRAHIAQDTPEELREQIAAIAMGADPVNHKGARLACEIIDSVGINELLAPRRKRGLSWPWPTISNLTGGLLPGEVWIIAALTSVGKTSAALQCALRLLQGGTVVVIFTLEMSAASLVARLITQLSRVHPEDADPHNRRMRAATAIHGYPLIIDEHSRTLAAMHASLRKIGVRHKIGLVVVDYLQLMQGKSRQNRDTEVGDNSRGLKALAVETNCPFIVQSQLNRGPDKENRRPRLSDLRESGSIEQDADGVVFLHPVGEPCGDWQAREVILGKQRDGVRDMVLTEFQFFGRTQTLEERQREEAAA